MMLSLGFKPRPHWWEANNFTTDYASQPCLYSSWSREPTGKVQELHPGYMYIEEGISAFTTAPTQCFKVRAVMNEELCTFRSVEQREWGWQDGYNALSSPSLHPHML